MKSLFIDPIAPALAWWRASVAWCIRRHMRECNPTCDHYRTLILRAHRWERPQ
ncbi:MAG: hypothetical protein V4669_13950 [Pseudomonadota bacterium]